MTEYGAPFDGVLLGDASVAPYSAAEWSRIWRLQQGEGVVYPNYGVFAGSGNGTYQPLEVRAAAIPSTNVEVQIGAAMVDGRFYETTAVVTLPITANVSGNPRIDTVILRLDYVAQTVRLVVKSGTPAGSPVRPTMQQDATYWEIPLADIAVANGFATLAQSTISQRQRVMRTQSMGWQSNAFPQNYTFGATPGAPFVLTPAQSVLLAIFLTGNMLLEDIIFRQQTPAIAYQFGWDLYVQDANDGNTSENTIRRIVQSNGDASGVSPGAGGEFVLAVMGAPFPLTPGIYWLVVQNRHATNNLTLDIAAGGAFDTNTRYVRRKVTTNPNGATLNAVTGWSDDAYLLFLRLRGRVFGMTTVL